MEDTGTQQHSLDPGFLAKYRIKGRLGTGGMCVVYEAEHVLMGKRVAIKILRPEFAVDPAISRRFEQEARAASRIHHPNAINVMDVGTTADHIPFIVMEFVDGRTLDAIIRADGPMRPERAANILRQAAGAVEAAHAAGIIHRDIKPQNIIVSRVDGQDWVKVVDFGVSKTLDDRDRNTSLTASNFIVGTPRYMSPEQCDGARIDARSDVYSLGVVLYEMLAGVPPFEDDSATRLLVRHTSEQPPPLRTRRIVAPEVDLVVMSALEKEPDRRPQSAAELSRLFDRAIGIGNGNSDDRGGASHRIEIPLGSDESTIIRPRAASTQADQPRATSIHTGKYAGSLDESNLSDRIYYYPRKRGASTGLVITLVGLLVVALGVAAYLYYNGSTSGTDSAQNSISSAQQSIADAIARLESLPADHPLRGYLPQLEQWQGELRAYNQVPDRTDAMKTAADQYKLKADQISGQARIAAAALARQANQNTAQPQASASSSKQPVEAPSPPNISGTPNRGEQHQPEDATSNANRRSPESLPRLPDKPLPSPPRPANSNSGM